MNSYWNLLCISGLLLGSIGLVICPTGLLLGTSRYIMGPSGLLYGSNELLLESIVYYWTPSGF